MEKFLSVLIASLLQSAASQGPQIQLPNGPIIGREGTTILNKHYYAFEKIPYAAAPVGELRFLPPIPPTKWTQPLQTVDFDVSCYQTTANNDYESEDCLYLAVFTPELPNNSNVSLPVMLFIHGGGFIEGTGMHLYGDRIVNEDVVFVTINYRVGIFGFISTQDEVIPGNNGLRDQQLAISWTHDNIHLFGGDPNKITIFGQSAGAASVAYQLLSPKSQGLFRTAILQSGTFLSPWAFQRRARDVAFATASLLNDTFLTDRNSTMLLEFLRTVDAEVLDSAAERYHNTVTLRNLEILQGFQWAPVIEVEHSDSFLTKKMYGLLQTGQYVVVPIIIGMTSEEGISYNQDVEIARSNMEAWDQNLDWLVPDDMGVTDGTNRTEIGRQIREIYTGGEPLADHLGDGVRYFSDTAFTRSIVRHADVSSDVTMTFFYQFSFDGELNHESVQYEGAEHVGHGQDAAYIFCGGANCDLEGYPARNQLTADRLVKLWTNFAKYRDPTPEEVEVLQNVSWPVVTRLNDNFQYLDIGDDLEIRNRPKEETYGKWKSIYDSLNYTDFDTY